MDFMGTALKQTLAKYSSWRNVQYGLFFVGLLVYVGMLFLLPETSHPGTMGMDKAEQELAAGSEPQSTRKFKWVWLNPLSCLWLLRSPNLTLVVRASSPACCAASDFLQDYNRSDGAFDRLRYPSSLLIGGC
jgi:hypothetical protein